MRPIHEACKLKLSVCFGEGGGGKDGVREKIPGTISEAPSMFLGNIFEIKYFAFQACFQVLHVRNDYFQSSHTWSQVTCPYPFWASSIHPFTILGLFIALHLFLVLFFMAWFCSLPFAPTLAFPSISFSIHIHCSTHSYKFILLLTSTNLAFSTFCFVQLKSSTRLSPKGLALNRKESQGGTRPPERGMRPHTQHVFFCNLLAYWAHCKKRYASWATAGDSSNQT